MLTARRRTFAARLGLLAFVLIVLAPVASQMRAEPADWSWLSELSCHDGGGSAPATFDGHRPVLQVDACGYCSLFSHCPVLAYGAWPLLGRLPLSRLDALQQPAPAWANARFPDALSRAPPMLT